MCSGSVPNSGTYMLPFSKKPMPISNRIANVLQVELMTPWHSRFTIYSALNLSTYYSGLSTNVEQVSATRLVVTVQIGTF